MTLHRALSPVRRRLRAVRMIRFLVFGLTAGCVLSLVYLLLTLLFLDRSVRWPFVLLSPAALSLGAGICSLFLPVPDRISARAADASGLQERCQTALEIDPETPMGQLLLEDTIQKLAGFRPERIPVRVSRKLLFLTAGTALACALILVLPNPGLQRALDRQAWEEKTAQMAREALEAADTLEETSAEEAEIRRILETLSRNLSASRDSEDVFLSLDQAEKMLSRAGSPSLSGDSTAPLTASRAMDVPDASLEGNRAENPPADDQKTASGASALSASGQSAPDTGTASSSSSMQTANALLAALRSSMNASASSAAARSPGSDSGTQANGNSGSQGSGQSPGQQASGGAGTGEGSHGDSRSNGNGSGQAVREGHYRETAFESIYDPEQAQIRTYDTSLSGQRLNGDGMQIETGPAQGMADGQVPLGQVHGIYAETAVEAARTMDLTSAQQDLVAGYFQALSDRQ